MQPVLFLFVLGAGLSSLASRGMPPGINFSTFIYPGVLSMTAGVHGYFLGGLYCVGPGVRVS